MSILVRDIEMPTRCLYCKFMIGGMGNDDCILQSAEQNEKAETWNDLKANCPLIEVPPHGRLIDADELKKDITEEAINLRMNGLKGTPRSTENHRWAIARLDEAPTIIEAERRET